MKSTEGILVRRDTPCKDERGLCEGSTVSCVGKGRLLCLGFFKFAVSSSSFASHPMTFMADHCSGKGGISCIFCAWVRKCSVAVKGT